MDKPGSSNGDPSRSGHAADQISQGATGAIGRGAAPAQEEEPKLKIQGKGLFGRARPDPTPSFGRRSSTSRWAAGILMLLAVGSFFRWYWEDAGKKFPVLSPGSYIGSLHGVLGAREADGVSEGESEGGAPVPLYIERAPETEDLFVAVLSPGWKPELVSTAIHAAGSAAPRWVLPLIVSQGAKRIQLTGLPLGQDRYGGEVVDLSSGLEGTWRLEPIRALPGDVGQGAQEVRLWLMLKAELEEVEARIGEFERRVPEQRVEIEKLTSLLTEGEELRSRANEKFGSVKEERAVADREFKSEQQKVQRLEASLEIAQKVTGMGKLVSLSRESLEREWRIVDSLLRSSAGSSAEALKAEFEKATTVLELKRQVEVEGAEVERLRAAQEKSSDARAQMRPSSRRRS